MILLPSIPELLQRTKALAALDLILSPDWEYRYFSFNAAWSKSEQMASMRDGCGNEWWLVFHSEGWAALKGLSHESEAWSQEKEKLSTALQKAMPPELAEFSREPAFRWESTSFAYFWISSHQHWQRANDLTSFSKLDSGEESLLCHLVDEPSGYGSFAENYYGQNIPFEVVADFFRHTPITDNLIYSLNPDITLSEIADELYTEIDYPR